MHNFIYEHSTIFFIISIIGLLYSSRIFYVAWSRTEKTKKRVSRRTRKKQISIEDQTTKRYDERVESIEGEQANLLVELEQLSSTDSKKDTENDDIDIIEDLTKKATASVLDKLGINGEEDEAPLSLSDKYKANEGADEPSEDKIATEFIGNNEDETIDFPQGQPDSKAFSELFPENSDEEPLIATVAEETALLEKPIVETESLQEEALRKANLMEELNLHRAINQPEKKIKEIKTEISEVVNTDEEALRKASRMEELGFHTGVSEKEEPEAPKDLDIEFDQEELERLKAKESQSVEDEINDDQQKERLIALGLIDGEISDKNEDRLLTNDLDNILNRLDDILEEEPESNNENITNDPVEEQEIIQETKEVVEEVETIEEIKEVVEEVETIDDTTDEVIEEIKAIEEVEEVVEEEVVEEIEAKEIAAPAASPKKEENKKEEVAKKEKNTFSDLPDWASSDSFDDDKDEDMEQLSMFD